jgi:hypothetical protein
MTESIGRSLRRSGEPEILISEPEMGTGNDGGNALEKRHAQACTP